MDKEKRKYPRLAVRDLHFDVSDGIGCCSGSILDVSQTGLCLVDLAKRFGKGMGVYTVVVASTGDCHWKFRVRPRWEQTGGTSKQVGVEIDEPPRQWITYVRSLESRRKKEVGSG
jgi:hypothetical protein